MNDVQPTAATRASYQGPFSNEFLVSLHDTVYVDPQGIPSRDDVMSAFYQTPGYMDELSEFISSDGYRWWCAHWFETSGGAVIIAFPNAYESGEGRMPDRGVEIYTQGIVSDAEMERVARNATDAVRTHIEKMDGSSSPRTKLLLLMMGSVILIAILLSLLANASKP